jgi:hypothetical protein
MERLESDDEELARREIEIDDSARALRIGEHFNVVWGDPTLYDLTLNTERVPAATCVDQIVALVKSAGFAETAASRQLLADLALRAKVRAVLKASPATQAIDVAIEASAGKVTLGGIVVDDRERAACEAAVAAIAGVASTDNQLKTMAGGMFRFPTQPRHN